LSLRPPIQSAKQESAVYRVKKIGTKGGSLAELMADLVAFSTPGNSDRDWVPHDTRTRSWASSGAAPGRPRSAPGSSFRWLNITACKVF